MKSTTSTLLALILLASPALAANPTIRAMKPVGGRRGTEVAVTLTGQRIADAKEILFYQPGIEATKIEEGKNGQVVATFRIAPDARLGLHDFRLRTASGLTALRTFSVGALEEIAEVEPNNDFSSPQPIPLNVTVNGVAANEDVDYYAVQAKKGQRITAEVEGIRLGLTLFDPYVAILDARRFELKSSDDSALIWQDGFVSVLAPEDGTYTIVVRESAYAGNANCLYRLHVGDYPRPTATVPAGGKLGDAVTVRWIGDVFGEKTTSLTLPASETPDFGLVAEDDRGSAPYPNSFRLSPFGNVIEAEPNNTPASATVFTPPVALNGVIGTAGDVDQYTFKATKGQTFDIRVFARQIRSPLDSVLSISAKNGGRVANNDDNNGPDSSIRFTAPKDGDFLISISDHLKKGGPDYAYRVEISAISPRVTLSTPNESIRRGTGVMAVSVPRGNRQAILINAARKDFGGGIAVDAADLPAGTRFEAETMKPSSSVVPVLFTAESTAPLGASLAHISGKPLDPKAAFTSEFQSIVELVLGQNNIPFWTRTLDALAVAVTDEAPFTIEIVEPKVPIVRGGTMDLKVVAHRKPGFIAPIAVSLLNNPSGIASKGGILIPEDLNEALIPLNANNGAELGTWKIVVNGSFNDVPVGPPAPGRRGAGGNRLTVSSQLADLTVAAPYLALKMNAASVEQGKDVDLVVKVNKLVDFDGQAKVTLIGLPNKAEAEPILITKESGDITFHIKTAPTTPVGETKSLFCQVEVIKQGEPILHNLGTGRLRIDAPLALKNKTVATASTSKPAAPGKPLSRLEKLRLESQERAKAAAEGNRPAGETPHPSVPN